MRIVIGLGACLALAACGKPAPQQNATAQAPHDPQVRIAQVGGTVFAQTVSASGTVTARKAQTVPGPAAPAASGGEDAAPNGYSLIVPLRADAVARIALGATAQVRFAAFENDIVVGRVVRLAPPVAGVVAVEIVLPRDQRLHGGLVGTARIVAKGAGSIVLAVPPSAVIGPHTGAAAVYVVDLATSRLHRRAVTLGVENADGIRVTAGLQQGEWVALTRTDQLHDGLKIAPVGPS